MAEAAAAVAAYEAVETVVQAGVVAGVALAQKTQPLHGTFTRFAVAPDGDGRSSLARSKHTSTVLHGKLHIFGGETSPGIPATNDMHILSLPNVDDSPVDYQCIPAVASTEGDEVPTALTNHEAIAIGDSIFFFNGSTPNETENLRIWEFSTTNLRWRETSLKESPALARRVGSGDRSALPKKMDGVLVASTHDATYVFDQTDETVDTLYYLDSHSNPSAIFRPIRFPAAEKEHLPPARQGAKLLPVTTGHGRNYLLLLPGTSTAGHEPSIWALQLPSTPSSSAAAKDTTRDTLDSANVPGSQAVLGGESGEWSWAEVQIEARNEEMGSEGKALPGPLAWYAADVVRGGEIVIWGGVDAKGETSGEGWVLKVR